MSDRIKVPLNTITGFLGSGKTTILKKVIESEEFGDSAVLINEFGEIGIDGLIVNEVNKDVVVLDSGCICCTIRGELSDAISDLLEKRRLGQIPFFSRIILETTGLADPGPISATIAHDDVLRHNIVLGQTLTVVDGVNWESSCINYSVWLDQLASCDQVWISKSDIAPESSIAKLVKRVGEINPYVDVVSSLDSIFTGILVDRSIGKQFFAPVTESKMHLIDAEQEKTSHNLKGITSFKIEINEDEFDWFTFGIWLSLLLKKHGDKILRVKGILYTSRDDFPVLIHGVQHVVHPPVHAPSLKEEYAISRLVFITKGMDRSAVLDSLYFFMKSRD
ncbi:cobalamin biosynthesis protein CobW [Marinobacter sp. Z-F4-2]|nr:cobalamin biosynthesis protein CobW [Marinobacter sp. Z-F4-2]